MPRNAVVASVKSPPGARDDEDRLEVVEEDIFSAVDWPALRAIVARALDMSLPVEYFDADTNVLASILNKSSTQNASFSIRTVASCLHDNCFDVIVNFVIL